MPQLILALSILLLTPFNAMAIEINDKGAQTLKASFQDLLDYEKNINEIFGTVQVIYDGEITVAQEKDYYALTLPRILLKSPEIEGLPEKFVLDLGVTKINAIPDDKPGQWKTTIIFPSQITMSDESKGVDQTDTLAINITTQNTMAIFNDALGYFTKLNLNFSDIKATSDGKDNGLSLGNLQIYANTELSEDNKLSGPGHVVLNNLIFDPQDDSESVKLGELKFDFDVTGAKAYTIKEYYEKTQKHSETLKSLAAPEEGIDNLVINEDRVIDMFFDLYNFKMDSFGFNYSLKDLEFGAAPNDETIEYDTLKIGSIFFGSNFTGLNAEKGMFNIKAGFDKIDILPAEPKYTDIIPQSLNFNISANNLPYEMLTDLGKTSAQAIIKNPDNSQMVGMSLLMRASMILAKSGTQITMEKNGVKNDVYDISLNGDVKADPTAVMSFTAKVKSVFEGLDSLLTLTKEYAIEPELKEHPTFNEVTKAAKKRTEYAQFNILIELLELIKTMGKSETGPNGKPAYSFEFEATKEGSFLLNGEDISPPAQ